MKKRICSICLLLITAYGHAQMARKPVTSIYNYFDSYSLHHVDALSFSSNQAALGRITKFTGGVYGEKRFLLQELSLIDMAVALPTPSGTFGIKGTYFGSSLNQEMEVGVAYGRKLSDQLSIGAGFNYFNTNVQGYGHAAAYNFEAGLLFYVSETLHAGIHAFNPTSSSLGKGDEEFLPSIYTAGVGYEPSDKFFVAATLQKVEDEDLQFNAGVQYQFDKRLGARAGFASSSYYLGFGFQLAAVRLDATATIHPQLGVTPGLQLLFERKEDKK